MENWKEVPEIGKGVSDLFLIERQRIAPLSHMFGCICVTLASVIKGATLVILSETFEPKKILEAVEKEQFTPIYGSPNAFIAMMEEPKYPTTDLKSPHSGIMGGAQSPMELMMKKVVDEIGLREIVIGYGLTESSSWITETKSDGPLELRVSTLEATQKGRETLSQFKLSIIKIFYYFQ